MTFTELILEVRKEYGAIDVETSACLRKFYQAGIDAARKELTYWLKDPDMPNDWKAEFGPMAMAINIVSELAKHGPAKDRAP